MVDEKSEDGADLVGLTTDLAGAYVSRNAIAIADLPNLIITISVLENR